jgi:hypothetical protein
VDFGNPQGRPFLFVLPAFTVRAMTFGAVKAVELASSGNCVGIMFQRIGSSTLFGENFRQFPVGIRIRSG